MRRRRALAILAAVAVIPMIAVAAIASGLVAAPGTRLPGVIGGGAGAAGAIFEKTADHGYIAPGATVELTDSALPALANLEPALLEAVRQAAAAAEGDGIHVVVTSGWRSTAYQQWLFDEAVQRYGTPEEASRWVAAPDTSHHVTGRAIDIGPFDATLWMQGNVPAFGFCQIYANELWHYELAADHGGACPALLDSAAG